MLFPDRNPSHSFCLPDTQDPVEDLEALGWKGGSTGLV